MILRQVLNALPLVFFIDGLSLFRAAASDQGSTLMSMIAPPTSDAVFRIAVMRSWGIDVVAALVTYRVVTIGTTALLGALFIVSWRHTRRQTVPHPAAQSNEPHAGIDRRP